MAQWQRVGFQIRRLGVRIPLASSRLAFLALVNMCGSKWPPRVVEPVDAMAQWQRVGFQIRRLGVRIPLASSAHMLYFCPARFSRGPERPAVLTPVPVAQLDKASDYESEDWGFESLQGYFVLFCGSPPCPCPDASNASTVHSACSVMVIIGASQALDPGSIPGRRIAAFLGH